MSASNDQRVKDNARESLDSCVFDPNPDSISSCQPDAYRFSAERILQIQAAKRRDRNAT